MTRSASKPLSTCSAFAAAPTEASIDCSTASITLCAHHANPFTLRLSFGPHCFRVILVECIINSPQHSIERNTCLPPCLDQSPVKGGQHQQRSASLLEPFFDLRKIIKVILHWA